MKSTSDKQRISNIPTNIITGFLGVGKTSAILHLLKNKPGHERWAVLVNEFGEIGIDGSLFQGQHREEQGVFVREVPGGCMCCVAGIPMQVALNQLLTTARPDRLLIEPTGLGHPLEVLEVLSGPAYQEVLSIQKILTLVDARKLEDARYTTHKTFTQQLAMADVVVGNKRDLYKDGDVEALKAYVREHVSSEARIFVTEQGVLDASWLTGPTQASPHSHHHHHHHSEPTTGVAETAFPESGYIRAVNEGEGFQSIGWRVTPRRVFDRRLLFDFFRSLEVERLKGVFITNHGIFGYNLTSDTLTEMELHDCFESRVEIIASRVEDDWEERLLSCSVETA